MTEDGSEFVTGEHISGHNGSFRLFPTGDDGHRPTRCPPAIAARIAAARAAAELSARESVRRGLSVPASSHR